MPLFQIAKGVSVPRQWELAEGFDQRAHDNVTSVRVNVSVDRLDLFFRRAIQELEEPLFLIIETPCSEIDEVPLRKDSNAPFHVDVYFSDLSSRREVIDIYSSHSDLLINDGFVRFGVASRDSKAEIFVAYYKIVHLFNWNVRDAAALLSDLGIPEVDHLVTAWDLFSEDSPGTKSRYRTEIGDIYDMIETLLRSGKIFFRETIEE